MAAAGFDTRHVSNWLTVLLFILAWPVALLTGSLLLTLAVFIGVVSAAVSMLLHYPYAW